MNVFINPTLLLLIIYALLCFVGGVIATYKVHSFISLIASSILALSVIIGTIRCFVFGKKKWVVITLSFASIFFFYRFYLKPSFFPSGLMLFLSLLGLIALLKAPFSQVRSFTRG